MSTTFPSRGKTSGASGLNMSATTFSGNYFTMQGVVHPIAMFNSQWLQAHCVLYEVIRVVNSRPIFLEQHLQRLASSCTLSGLQSPPIVPLARQIMDFLARQPIDEQNLKVCLCYQAAQDTSPLQLGFLIPSAYPSASSYQQGVAVALLPSQRASPNVKAQNLTLRDEADRLIKALSVYEVMLVDAKGNITEGSRSNLFFVDGDSLVTAPASEVLLGITRGVVLELARANGIPCHERTIGQHEIPSFAGAFITGTSPKVLPIRSIDKHAYPTIPQATRTMMRLYDERMQKEIGGNQTLPSERHE